MKRKLNAVSRSIYDIGDFKSKEFKHGYLAPEHLLFGFVSFDGTSKLLEANGITYDYLTNAFSLSDSEVLVEDCSDVIVSPLLEEVLEFSIKHKTDLTVTPIDLLYAISKVQNTLAYNILASKEELLSEIENLYFAQSKKSSERGFDRGMSELESVEYSSLKEVAPTLSKYAVDLTDLARNGEINEVYFRDDEIINIIQVLCRKNKSNVCLVGHPGVGKTAVVEGLAIEIANNQVPDYLKNTMLVSLDMSVLIGGARYRGDFEERLKKILSELVNNPNIILFIDELHNLLSLGKSEGSLAASEILKPALARGQIKCIGATTFEEYHEFIEKDGAFERRFQKVTISEPSSKDVLRILEKSKWTYESHHNVRISQNILEYIVNVSSRYLTNRHFPDKAFDLLDDACSVTKVKNKNSIVSKETVNEVMLRYTGIPISENDSANNILNLKTLLTESIVGQEDALDSVFKGIALSKSGFRDENRPMASFIFCGPTGVGKTETAKIIAREIMKTPDSFIRLDMSEYMEQHSVSKLIGSAPGYIGFENGGILTEAVKRNPYSVILFDEIEKAHRDISNILLQILDYGCLSDNRGVKVDFKNTIIILTSNVYSSGNSKTSSLGFLKSNSTETDYLDKKDDAIKSLISVFSPEFINRLDDVIVFNSLDNNSFNSIIKSEVDSIVQKLKKRDITLTVKDDVYEHLIEKCAGKDFSARNIKGLIEKEILCEISLMILNGDINPKDTISVNIINNKIKVLTNVYFDKSISIDAKEGQAQ